MEETEYEKHRHKLGFDFCANFSFCFGVAYPIPTWFRDMSTWQKNLWSVYRKFGDLMTVLLFISNVVMVSQQYNDIQVLTTCTGTITYIICVTVKLTVFRKQMKIINGVADSLLTMSHDLVNNPVQDDGFFSMHDAVVGHVKLFGLGKNVAVAGGVSTLAFFEIAVGYFRPDMKKLPMSAWFPFDPFADPAFVISCLFQLVSYLSFLLKDIAIDLFFLTVLVTFNSYLIYLRRLLQLIIKDGECNPDPDKKRKKLVWWIKQYQTLLGTIEDFKIISNPYLFVKYGSVAIILFFGGVLVTSEVVYDMVQQMIVLSINLSNLLQLYIFSVIGDKITENAAKVAEGGFNIEMLTDRRSNKMLYFFSLCRSKKPVMIQFGRINPLCVHSFGQIVKMCFSYFTTIVQVRSEKQTQSD